MLFSNSPLKKVAEKLNPFSQKNKISRLKFERKNDYKTFLKFIKDSTKEIENIKISDPEDKKRKGLMLGGGILGLALLGSFGKGERDSDDSAGKLKSITGVIEKSKADAKRAISGGKDRRKLDQGDDVLDKARFERSKRLKKIRKQFQKKGSIEQRKINVKEYLEKRKNRKFKKVRKKYAKRIKQPGFSVNPTKKREFAGVTGDTLDDNQDQKFKRTRRGKKPLTYAGSDGDTKIGFPSKKDIKGEKKLTRNFLRKETKRITSPKQGETKISQDILDRFNRAVNEADKIGERAKRSRNKIQDQQIKERKLNQLRQQEIFNRQYGMDGGYGDSNIGDLTQNKSNQKKIKGPSSPIKNYGGNMGFKEDFGTTRVGKVRPKPGFIIDPLTNEVIPDPKRKMKVDRSKFFEAPEIPKNETKKISRLDRFTGRVNRINKFLSPVSNFASAIFKPKNYLKFLLIKDMLKVEPFADGTLEGKPGVGVNLEKFTFDEDMAVNIFMPPEGRESMIPFSADVELPSVSTPTSLQSPDNKIVVDYESSSSEDLFFIKMAGL